MAKPKTFSFSIAKGNPVRLATALRDIVTALEPLTDEEAADVLRELGQMYEAPTLGAKLLDALEGIVVNHDKQGCVDESWWKAGREAIAEANGRG
ncbi:MAG: hypothetical protein AAB721_02945 [Patescibacteria group bacterium]